MEMASIGTYLKYAGPSAVAYAALKLLLVLLAASYPDSAKGLHSGTMGAVLAYAVPALLFCYAGFRAITNGGLNIVETEAVGFAAGLLGGVLAFVLTDLRIAVLLALNGSIGLLGARIPITPLLLAGIFKIVALSLLASFAGGIVAIALRNARSRPPGQAQAGKGKPNA